MFGRLCRGKLVSHKGPFIADQRGAVAFEMPFVFFFLMMILLLPLADVAIAGFRYISAWQALRAFGQSIQYSPPLDVTSTSSWSASAIATAEAALGYPILNFKVLCDGVTCTSANSVGSIKSYSYQTSITLTPMTPGLKSVLCPNGCTLPYSERFQ